MGIKLDKVAADVEAGKSVAESVGQDSSATSNPAGSTDSVVGDANFTPAPAEPRAPSAEAPQPDEFIFTCHPLERFQIGPRFRFERGQFKTRDPELAQALRDYLKDPKVDPRTKQLVREIDRSVADAYVRKHISQGRRGVVESADALNQAGQQVGTVPVIPE